MLWFPTALQTLGYQNLPLNESANLSQHAEGQQELMQTEDENRLLRHRLNTHRDQATGIESSLAEVAQLTEVFTQQVMQQSEQIELLYTEVSLACVTWLLLRKERNRADLQALKCTTSWRCINLSLLLCTKDPGFTC